MTQWCSGLHWLHWTIFPVQWCIPLVLLLLQLKPSCLSNSSCEYYCFCYCKSMKKRKFQDEMSFLLPHAISRCDAMPLPSCLIQVRPDSVSRCFTMVSHSSDKETAVFSVIVVVVVVVWCCGVRSCSSWSNNAKSNDSLCDDRPCQNRTQPPVFPLRLLWLLYPYISWGCHPEKTPVALKTVPNFAQAVPPRHVRAQAQSGKTI